MTEQWRDTEQMHKADLVAKILADAQQGMTQEQLRRTHHVALRFIQNVLHDNRSMCSCGRVFFAQRSNQRFGSKQCYGTAIQEMLG